MATTTIPTIRTAALAALGALGVIFAGAVLIPRAMPVDPASTVRPPAITVVATTPAPAEPTAGLIPPACDSIDQAAYPCGPDTIRSGEQAMGVRW